ncbi:MAG: hypothetical protein KA264_03025 [Crocinitomicaceae bacterium]|nr:hypothetical protein [Crocinitomicaceae bacterium]
MLRIVTILLIILPNFVNSQLLKTNWGEFYRSKGLTFDLLQGNDGTIYSLTEKRKFIFSSYYMNKIEHCEVLSSGKIQQKIGNSYGKIVFVHTMNNLPIVFLSDTYKNKQILYAQTYSKNATPSGPAIELMQATLDYGWGTKGTFSIIYSENNGFFCVEYKSTEDKQGTINFNYKIFNTEFKTIHKGTYSTLVKNESIENQLLTNTGDYFVTTKIYNQNENPSFWGTEQQLHKVICKQLNKDTITPAEIELQNQRIVDLQIATNENGQISLAGSFAENEDKYNGVTGFFYKTFDYQKDVQIDAGMIHFPLAIITHDLSERAKRKIEKKQDQSQEIPGLYEYKIQKVYTLKDSSVIAILEQNYIETQTYTDPRTGYISTRNIYHYNDLIALKIKNKNELDWIEIIPKKQTSINDKGFYSSFSSILRDSALVLFFNDDLFNYDNEGNWKQKENSFFQFNRPKTILAICTIDLLKGKQNRSCYINPNEKNSIFIPSLFKDSPSNKKLILYQKNMKKERIGILNY